LIAVVLIGLIGGIAGYFLTRDKEIVPTVLGIPNNLEITDKTLTWDEVDNAKSYIIDIDGTEYKADETIYSLDKLIEIKVYEIKIKAIGDGEIYLNSEWSEVKNYIVWTNLTPPNGLEIIDKTLTWNEVPNAKSYLIDIDGEEKTSENANYSLDELVDIKIYEIKIKAIGDGEIYFSSEWSEIIKYTVSMNLNAPNGLEIDDKTLTWTAVENAKSYIIDIDGEEYKADEAIYSLDKLIEIKVYEIKIKAIGDGKIYLNSEWSEIIKHTVSTTLNVPNGLEIVDKTLIWNEVPNAKGYIVFVNGAEHEVIDEEYLLEYLPTGKYEITVQAIGNGITYLNSELSGIKNYTATEKLNAPNGLQINDKLLTWNAVDNAKSYIIYINGAENPSDKASYSLEGLTAGIYGIKVKAIGDDIYLNSEWSGIKDYTVTEYLNVPQDLQIEGTTLKWTAVPHAASYEVWVNGTETPSGNASYSLAYLTAGQYDIKVKAIGDDIYLNSEWSGVKDYKVTEKLNAPDNLQIDDKLLTWNAVEHAKSYVIYINGAEKPSGTASYSLENLTAGQYDIKVKAIGDDIYLNSEWSEEIKNYTVTAVLTEPKNLKIEGTTLKWTAVPNATNYKVWIGGTEYNAASAEYSLVSLTEAGEYNIKVKAIGDGTFYLNSEWSGVKNHIVSEKLNAPEGLQIEGTTLKWNVVPNAEGYEVWINGAEKGTVDGTEYSPENLEEMSLYEFKVAAIGDGEVYLDSGLSDAKYWHFEDKISSTSGLSFTLTEDNTAYLVKGGTATDKNIIIPPTYEGKPVKEIAYRAFAERYAMTSVFIPNSVEIIWDQAFVNCSNLTGDLIIPNSVKTIGNDAFANCRNLNGNLVIPDSVETIGDRAFQSCSGLTSIEIPDSVESIGNYAFIGCSKLESVTVNRSASDSITTLGNDRVFEGCNALTSIYVPADSVDAYKNANYWKTHIDKITAIEQA
jgi:hypothetical protein